MDQKVQEKLEGFLSWLLDCRWFPERATAEKGRRRRMLRSLRRILVWMQAFCGETNDARLREGLELWQSYEETLTDLAKQQVRTAPQTQIQDLSKGELEIAERLLCAVLIIRKLWPEKSAYQEVRKVLADPTQLPRPVTIKERLRHFRYAWPTISKSPVSRKQIGWQRKHCDIPLRPLWISLKGVQSKVERLQNRIKAHKHWGHLLILQRLYGEYVGVLRFQFGFSEADAAMLESLAPEGASGREEDLQSRPHLKPTKPRRRDKRSGSG